MRSLALGVARTYKTHAGTSPAMPRSARGKQVKTNQESSVDCLAVLSAEPNMAAPVAGRGVGLSFSRYPGFRPVGCLCILVSCACIPFGNSKSIYDGLDDGYLLYPPRANIGTGLNVASLTLNILSLIVMSQKQSANPKLFSKSRSHWGRAAWLNGTSLRNSSASVIRSSEMPLCAWTPSRHLNSLKLTVP